MEISGRNVIFRQYLPEMTEQNHKIRGQNSLCSSRDLNREPTEFQRRIHAQDTELRVHR